MKDVVECLPFELLDHENIPATTYKLTGTIRNKVFNYKQAVESIQLDQKQPQNDDIYPCNYENSEFYGTDHQVIRLNNPFTKGPNFRELQSLNHFVTLYVKKEIDHAIEKFA